MVFFNYFANIYSNISPDYTCIHVSCFLESLLMNSDDFAHIHVHICTLNTLCDFCLQIFQSRLTRQRKICSCQISILATGESRCVIFIYPFVTCKTVSNCIH